MQVLTKLSEYAIRALTHLAAHPQERILVKDLCRSEKLPPHFTRKALQLLMQHGYVTAFRGPGGGYTLSHKPEEIRLDKIIQIFEPAVHPPVRGRSHAQLDGIVQLTTDFLQGQLQKMTIASLLPHRPRPARKKRPRKS